MPASEAPRVTITDMKAVPTEAGWGSRQRDSAMAILETNRRRWNAMRPPRYRYWQEGVCFCTRFWPGPRVITVVHGRVVSATDAAGTRTDSALLRRAPNQLAGLDALFDRIAESIGDGAIDEVRVDYDGRCGFPTRIEFDPSRLVNDDEYTLIISHFEALVAPLAPAPHDERCT